MDAPIRPTRPLFRIAEDPEYGDSLATSSSQFASLSQPIQDTYRIITSASEFQSLSEDLTLSLKQALGDGVPELGRLRELLEQQEIAQKHTRDFIHSCVRSVPVTLRPTAASAVKAEQVFATPELLEQIFLYLSPRDVLLAMQMNKAAARIVHGSPKLRDKLSLRPHPDGFLSSVFHTPFDSWDLTSRYLPCIRLRFDPQYDQVRSSYSEWSASPKIEYKRANRVGVILDWLGDSLPRVGSLCRGMFVCQPPTTEMAVAVDCCHLRGPVRKQMRRAGTQASWDGGSAAPSTVGDGHDQGGDEVDDGTAKMVANDVVEEDITETLVLRSKTGITIGDVYDATLKLRDVHRHCPHACIELHSNDGVVVPPVTFDTMLTLKHDDPSIIKEAEEATQRELNDIQAGQTEQVRSRQILGVYVKAKLKAHENGWLIPKFEEFKVKHGVEDV